MLISSFVILNPFADFSCFLLQDSSPLFILCSVLQEGHLYGPSYLVLMVDHRAKSNRGRDINLFCLQDPPCPLTFLAVVVFL